MPADEQAFLRADFEHVAASFLVNEELGEKRVASFTTLVGVFFGGVGFLTTQMKDVATLDPYLAVAGASLVLLMIGGLTIRRLIRRNEVTDRYKRVLRAMRKEAADDLTKKYRHLFGGKMSGEATAADDAADEERSVANGGHVYVVGVLQAALTAILFWSVVRYNSPAISHAPDPSACKCCACQESPKPATSASVPE